MKIASDEKEEETSIKDTKAHLNMNNAVDGSAHPCIADETQCYNKVHAENIKRTTRYHIKCTHANI